jgi:hypothetical protein
MRAVLAGVVGIVVGVIVIVLSFVAKGQRGHHNFHPRRGEALLVLGIIVIVASVVGAALMARRRTGPGRL